MKKTLTLLTLAVLAHAAKAQDVDTLINHTDGVALEAGKYTVPGTWGFYAGHNSFGQQQFGEKYLVDDHVHVLGVVAHLNTSTGTVTNADTELDFRIWKTDAEGKPAGSSSLEDGHIDLGNVNLGGPTVIMFHKEAHVEDAFFVSLDLGDYSHHPLEGDTVGLYYAPHGSRSEADIAAIPYRNVFQIHGHGSPDWKDFYTGATTPSAIATHFAIYPIVEFEEEHNSIASLKKNGLEVAAPYPNPALDKITLPFTLTKSTQVSIRVMDVAGRVINEHHKGQLTSGSYNETIDISDLPGGIYYLTLSANDAAMAIRIAKTI